MQSETYKQKIDRMIRESTGEIILNGTHEHAAIILERMFAHASESVRILTRKFDPRTYCVPETVAAARSMLTDRKLSIMVLVEEIDSINSEHNPYLGEFRKLENFQIKEVADQLKSPVDVNFALMDERGYRFERDQSGATAVVSFGEKTLTHRLKRLFDDVWVTSNDLRLLAV
ncbi:MAG: hypothetical protein AAF739_02680 [Pseudomonadota bacterium]